MEKIKKLWAWVNKCRSHKMHGSVLVSKETVENHRGSDRSFIWTINVRRCLCGELFNDNGCEFRRDPFSESEVIRRKLLRERGLLPQDVAQID
jgi:hypothetical protein